jgi:DNA-binding GntR family transcriptional regulator
VIHVELDIESIYIADNREESTMKRREPPTAPPRKKRGTGREVAYQMLREQILNLTLEPGTALDEASLVRELRLSRTPLREALVRLASENLVELLPNRGASVAEISVAKLAEYFEALGVVQRATHRWAATRRSAAGLAAMRQHRDAFAVAVRQDPSNTPTFNRGFHSAIAASCENAHFARLYEELQDQGLRLARLTVLHDAPAGVTAEMHAETLVREHAEIFAAIKAGDAAEADRLAGIHNDLFRRRVFDYFLNRRGSGADAVSIP